MSRIVNSTMPKRIATFGMICATTLAVSACQTLGMNGRQHRHKAGCLGIGAARRGSGGL